MRFIHFFSRHFRSRINRAHTQIRNDEKIEQKTKRNNCINKWTYSRSFVFAELTVGLIFFFQSVAAAVVCVRLWREFVINFITYTIIIIAVITHIWLVCIFISFFFLSFSRRLAFSDSRSQPKRLHVSNIPFRFRDPDLRAMFGVSVQYLYFYMRCIVVLDAFCWCRRDFTFLYTHEKWSLVVDGVCACAITFAHTLCALWCVHQNCARIHAQTHSLASVFFPSSKRFRRDSFYSLCFPLSRLISAIRHHFRRWNYI